MSFRYGTDEEFTFKVGKDVAYNGKCFRISQRIVFNDTGVKKYLLQCCDCKHDCQQVQLEVDGNDDTLLSEVTCETVLTDVWSNVPFNGNFDITANYLRNRVFSRCDVNNKSVTMSLDNGNFKLNFNGTEYTKTPSTN
tara:strand:+ start:203 stop:616 length:414 start_codon:yes stop_codon:yes gene_type:complete